MQDLQQLPDSEIDMLATTARDNVSKLEVEAKRLELEAADAVAAFKASPSSKTLPAKEIAAQLAENAATKLAEAITAAQPLIDEVTRRSKTQRLHDLHAQLDWRGDAEACATRIAEAYAEFHAVMRKQIDLLTQKVCTRNSLLSEANSLEQYAGNGGRHGRLQFSAAVSLINQRLEARFGAIENTGDGSEMAQLTHWVPNNKMAKGVCEAKFRIAAPITQECV